MLLGFEESDVRSRCPAVLRRVVPGHANKNLPQTVVAEAIDRRTTGQAHGFGCPPLELLLGRTLQIQHVDRPDQSEVQILM